ncbi:hypothetical protein GGR51DRAFT_496597 [Nemania sp. FL0031]|nr:hypothetical protein GGR51DRAFT_496597 [Nemania sp. FL0031]
MLSLGQEWLNDAGTCGANKKRWRGWGGNTVLLVPIGRWINGLAILLLFVGNGVWYRSTFSYCMVYLLLSVFFFLIPSFDNSFSSPFIIIPKFAQSACESCDTYCLKEAMPP